MKRRVAFGIKILCWVYLINAILYMASLLLCFNNIYVFGHKTGIVFSFAIRFLYILVPLYLFFALKKLKKSAWVIAVIFSSYFALNNFTEFLYYKGFSPALVHINGMHNGISTLGSTQITLLFLSIVLNLGIIFYLCRIKYHFRSQGI